MNRRDFLKNAALSTGLLITGCECRQGRLGTNAARPNVLIINIDDMGYGDMSCHGNPKFRTPHLDALHAESIRFTQFHVAPMCTPTRGQLLTGIDALRNGARWVGTENTHLRHDLPTMAELFRDAGYRTGLFGKWHIGDNYPMRPQDRGFDEVVWHPQQEVGTVADYWGNDYFDDTYEHNGVRKKYDGYCTDVWFSEAMNWMQKQARAKQPFLGFLPTNVVHGPYFVDQKYRDRVNIPNLPKEFETFFGMMVNLDDNMGRLDDFLQKTDLKDNTIVIFMTDNGATAGYHTYNAGMKGYKTQLWDGGHRVPLFVRWPKGNLRAPGDIHGLAQVQDLLPTLLELCGIQPPTNPEFDGMSLAPQLRGQAELPDRMMVIQFQRHLAIKKWDACILWGPWRLMNIYDVDPYELDKELIEDIERRRKIYEVRLGLYNIDRDPRQNSNIIDEHPDVVAKMKAYYEQWWTKVEPTFAIPRPIIIGNDAENPCFLTTSSWANQYFVQIQNIMDGRRANGFWNLRVDRAGMYEFALYRWPKEADTPISGKTDLVYTDPYSYGLTREGVTLPIAQARMQIADFDAVLPVGENDRHVIFNAELKPGDVKLQTWFNDADGKEICGAYYVYVTRK